MKLLCAMGKRAGKTNMGEGGQGKMVRTTSDDRLPSHESVCVKSKATGGKFENLCVRTSQGI
jgi:hypothetical protein